LLDHGSIENGLRLAASMGELWSYLGLSGEGYAWLRRLLDLPAGATTGRTRARAQCWAGGLGLMVGDADAGQALLLDSLAFGRAASDHALVGEAAVRLGLLILCRGDYATARQLFEESLAARRRSGNREQIVRSTHFVALATIWQGESDDATQALLEGALADAQAIGYRNWTAALVGALGLHALMHGDHGLARTRWDESLRLFEGSMDWPEVSKVQNYLAGLDSLEGNLDAARAGYAASIALTRPARFVFRATESLDGLAVIDAKQGHMDRALRVAGASAAFRQAAGYQPPPYVRAELERWLTSARRAVGATAAETAWVAGQAMSFDQAVDEALAL
jgi:tetratricopeptide (TPR) repeat protein